MISKLIYRVNTGLLFMKQSLLLVPICLIAVKSPGQKHSIDLSGLISNYSDIGGQNTNMIDNNVLSYTSFGSLDYRLSYYYNKRRSNIFAIELEASRRTVPTSAQSRMEYLSESYGIGMLGTGKRYWMDSLMIQMVSGFTFLLNKIYQNNNPTDSTHLFLTTGLSIGADLAYRFVKHKRNLNSLYIKTGFRCSLEIISFNVNNTRGNPPKNGIASILFGVGTYF